MTSELSPTADSVEIVPGGPVRGRVRPPGSKSLTNRALICAAFGHGQSKLTGALSSEDTAVMIDSLRQLGITVQVEDGGKTLTVAGAGPRSASLAACDEMQSLFVANSGTTIRFLTAALSAWGGHFQLHGVDRMHERPIGDLVAAIAPILDGTIQTRSPGNCPPVEIHSGGWRDGELTVAGNVSSQFLSGLMMAAPLAGAPITICVEGELVSVPYVSMTSAVMRSFGACVRDSIADAESGQPQGSFVIDPAPYRGTEYAIEPDASAASYFWASAAITAGKVTVEGLSREALQGDVGFCDALERMGCGVAYEDNAIVVEGSELQGIDINMNAISDTVQTLAVVALFANSPTRVRGVAHNRFKETDRIGDLARELRRLGADIDEHDDGMTIHPLVGNSDSPRVLLETYNDHRMAMSLSLAGLRIAGVSIANPACTSKTYPEFFADLESLTGRAHDWSQ